MSYPPTGGYPMYGPPSMQAGGPTPYPGPPSRGPALGFDNLTNPAPMGGPGVPYGPPGGMPMAMPTPGGPPSYPGMPPQMPPAMPSGMPMPNPVASMPPHHSGYGAQPMPHPTGGYAPPTGGYGPPRNLSFGAAALATSSFQGHYRGHGGPPIPQPHVQPNLAMAPRPSAPPPSDMSSFPPMPSAHGPPPSAPAQFSMPSGGSSYKSSTSHSTSSYSSSTSASTVSSSHKTSSHRASIKAHSSFDAENDAELLRKAMKGLGCDSKVIMNLLCLRTNAQRLQIELAYKTMHGRDLLKDLQYELGGNFEDIVVALMMSAADYDATSLRKAIKGLGTDESVLIEILCTRTNTQISAIKQSYQTLFSRDLEKDVAGDTSGHFKKFLVSLLQAYRDESSAVDMAKAQTDAQALYKAGEGRWGTDESKFNTVFGSRSFPQLKATFDEYSKICKYDIEESVKREMSGNLRDGMLSIVQVVRNTPAFFAEKLHKSMKGLGTDDKTLIRIIVTRSEVDLLDIRDEFAKMYHISLAKFISDDTRGNYKKILLQLITEKR